MKYRVTKKRNKSGKEKTLITDEIEKAEKEYLSSCETNYFTLLEKYNNGKWERILFQIEQGNIEKELEYVIRGEE